MKLLNFHINLELVNRGLVVFIVGMTVYGLIPLVLPTDDVLPASGGREASLKNDEGRDIATRNIKPFEVYEQRLKRRDLFLPVTHRSMPQETAVLEKALPALHKRVKLIGILMDDDSKAIVEDLQENQTHFLSQGEQVGEILLEDIREDKVIFQYGGKLVEMSL